jgi:hypothetical protein
VAWQDAQPPALNIVLPLSTLGVYAGNADAGTVAGKVSNQTTARAATRMPAAMSVTVRIRRDSFLTMFVFSARPRASAKPGFRLAPASRIAVCAERVDETFGGAKAAWSRDVSSS